MFRQKRNQNPPLQRCINKKRDNSRLAEKIWDSLPESSNELSISSSDMSVLVKIVGLYRTTYFQ
jgi:hypothetical protein